jgi:hypothetical protein
MTELRPIETAPKDGTRICGIDKDGDTRLTWFGKTSHVPIYGWCWNDGDPENTDLWWPIYWRPAA